MPEMPATRSAWGFAALPANEAMAEQQKARYANTFLAVSQPARAHPPGPPGQTTAEPAGDLGSPLSRSFGTFDAVFAQLGEPNGGGLQAGPDNAQTGPTELDDTTAAPDTTTEPAADVAALQAELASLRMQLRAAKQAPSATSLAPRFWDELR